jgi:hypothetical protein
MNLFDIINLDFAPAAYLTVAVMALFTSMAVEAFIKPMLAEFKDHPRYELYLNLSALAWGLTFSYLGILAAGAWGNADVAMLTQALFRGLVAMFLAVFGYKGYRGVWKRISGRSEEEVLLKEIASGLGRPRSKR